MSSNVELKCVPLTPLIDSPDIDPNTQRPRTPNTLQSGMPKIQRDNVAKHHLSYFDVIPPPKPLKSFHRNTHTYITSRRLLYKQDKNDFFYIGPQWSRQSEPQHNGSPLGAAISWPREKAGELIEKHLKSESREHFLGLELERRPPTNVRGTAVTRYGRSTCGYYAQRFPNRDTYFITDLDLKERAPMIHPVAPQTTLDYRIADAIQNNYIKHLTLPTEYQDRYLAHIPVPKKV